MHFSLTDSDRAALSEARIISAESFGLPLRRPKYIGKNSQRDDHGDTVTERVIRLRTNTGPTGIGTFPRDANALPAMVGHTLGEYFTPGHGFASPLGGQTMVLWDLAGRVLGRPVWELLGGEGPERVPAYDGTIYLTDLMPEYSGNWRERFREEIGIGRSWGHTAFKVKIGRGNKWMEAEEGYRRDLEVLRIVRDSAGPDAVIGADANNSYGVERAHRFIADTVDLRLAFVEELFPETVDDCLALKALLRQHGLPTLVADGETLPSIDPLVPLMEAEALDILQADMNYHGIESIYREARIGVLHGVRVGPHNWGSLLGFYQQAQVGRGIPNFYRIEHDLLATGVLATESYRIEDGLCTVTDAPGFGLAIDEERLKEEAVAPIEVYREAS